MDRLQRYNPFSRRRERTASELATYRVLTLATWAVACAASIYYTFRGPGHWHGRRIGDQNRQHPTGFTLNMLIVDIYWIFLFSSQSSYISYLFAASNPERLLAAIAVGSHFIAHNILHVLFLLAFISSHFFLAEIILAINFLNLTYLYFLHPMASHPRAIVHLPTVAGPLAWTVVALFWNGAMAFPHPHHAFQRLLSNVFIWCILGYGLFYVLILGDYTIGFCLSVLTAALGAGQFLHHMFTLQWIFAFIIMSILFLATLLVAVPSWFGSAGESVVVVVTGENERAPLLE